MMKYVFALGGRNSFVTLALFVVGAGVFNFGMRKITSRA